MNDLWARFEIAVKEGDTEGFFKVENHKKTFNIYISKQILLCSAKFKC